MNYIVNYIKRQIKIVKEMSLNQLATRHDYLITTKDNQILVKSLTNKLSTTYKDVEYILKLLQYKELRCRLPFLTQFQLNKALEGYISIFKFKKLFKQLQAYNRAKRIHYKNLSYIDKLLTDTNLWVTDNEVYFINIKGKYISPPKLNSNTIITSFDSININSFNTKLNEFKPKWVFIYDTFAQRGYIYPYISKDKK